MQVQQKVKHEGAMLEEAGGNQALQRYRSQRISLEVQLDHAHRPVRPAMLQETCQALYRQAHAQMIYPVNRDEN